MKQLTAILSYALEAPDQKIRLQLVADDGQTYEFLIEDPVTLDKSLHRAMKAQEVDEMASALLIKPQPAGQMLDDRWDV